MQQPARHAGLARDLIEGRSRGPARGDAGPHRVDDPDRLVTRELGLGRYGG
jgi:hypothetical protein